MCTIFFPIFAFMLAHGCGYTLLYIYYDNDNPAHKHHLQFPGPLQISYCGGVGVHHGGLCRR